MEIQASVVFQINTIDEATGKQFQPSGTFQVINPDGTFEGYFNNLQAAKACIRLIVTEAMALDNEDVKLTDL